MLWKSPIINENSIHRQTVFLVKMPGSDMEMDADGIEMSDKEQVSISLKKTETDSRKLLGFADFSYEYWKNSSEQALIENRLVNLTVSQRSWSAELEKHLSVKKSKFVVSLRKSIMSPKTEENLHYVGWWNEKASENFASEESEVKLSVDLETQMISSNDLVAKYRTVEAKDVENLLNQLIVTKIILSYPLYQNKEAVTFDGYYILSGGADVFRFQESSVLRSNYNDLEMISHSFYKSDSEMKDLDHISEFIHLETQKKAFHTIEYKTLHPPGQCTKSYLRHYIRSPAFDLTSRVDRWCHSEDPQLYTLTLNITTHSACWDLLRSKTDQFIQDIRTDYAYEECHYENKLATIDVRAEWFGEKNVDHNKTAMFCSKKSRECAKLYLETKHYGSSSLDLSIPAENQPLLSFKKKMSADYPNIDVQVQYRDSEDEMDVLRVLADTSNVNNPVWTGMFDTLAFQKVKNIFTPVWSNATDAIKRISQQTNHPLNIMLKPVLKKSLYKLWKDLNKKRTELEKEVWIDLDAAMKSIQPFYSSLQTVASNSLTVMRHSIWKAYNTLREESVIVWSLDYFDVPYYLQRSFGMIPYEIKNFATKIFMKDQRFIQFQFTTAEALKLASFKEWRLMSSEYIKKYLPMFRRKENAEAHYRPSTSAKVGMIFGPNHVYTFDGHLYSIPPYPNSDCVLLLSHDLHSSQFTILSTQESLHVLFPEMSVTINSNNEVFINGNDVPTITPIQADNGKVVITRGSNLHVWSPSLQVTCRSEDFLCIFELNSWHTGGTFGLLGDADGISTNDYKLPNGKRGNLPDFVSSYDVTGNPMCKEFTTVTTPKPSDEDKEVCSELFRDICPDKKEIKKLLRDVCVDDVAMGTDACYSASGLSALCYYKNIDTTTGCHGKKQESQIIGQKLEVVLMVQEHKSMMASNKNKILKGLENLCFSIDKQFKDNGYSTVLFSLVGFGGQDTHYPATVHSTKGGMWHEISEVNDLIKSLEFKGKTEADNIEALKFVSEVLGYDAFHSKVFVAVTVDDNPVQNKKQTDEVRNFLESNGITLYTISSYAAVAKKQKVFGVRADGLIFPSHKTGEAYLDYPKGALAKLTSATRGSVFLAKFLLENEPGAYFKEIATEMWAKIHKEAQSCKTCKSVRSGWWWNVNQCSIVQC
ncbi:uncharacterized protein LOC129234685 [Uloborus diversus]|uniref:uncharacterized protein LOC129234685 n=1 Tax=Uloborus diversus TaxID=327109 RepID=UPI00240A3C22|nr:uncharacterized protein LOC129234685 [Uloborus diversus]